MLLLFVVGQMVTELITPSYVVEGRRGTKKSHRGAGDTQRERNSIQFRNGGGCIALAL